ncbi:MAG: thiamine biosynthesis protein [Thaumarchaeota archaeon]|nr:thiamine biosynthesis protein [Nitrososphaerota archaeon]
MNEPAFVVVFPSIFAKNKQNLLISNVKKILKVQNQQFGKVTPDDELIIIDANDPVFASTAINLLFGIDQVSIARRVENKFNVVVSAIAKIGTNLLLRGEQFYVRVDGHPTGYLPKDVEIAATSALIEKTVDMECRPGTEHKHDKMIHCFLTRKNAYVSIFLEKGHGGIPYNSQGEQILCCVYDELSAVSCIEAIKQGFDVRILVCYDTDSNLMDLCYMAKKEKIQKICLALSPLAFPSWLIEQNLSVVSRNKLIPWIALAGLDESIINTAKEIGLGKYLSRIEKFGVLKFAKASLDVSGLVLKAVKSRQSVMVRIGPNNIHDILDSLNH